MAITKEMQRKAALKYQKAMNDLKRQLQAQAKKEKANG